MIESNDETMPEELNTETPVSQGVMFTTMLLLICGLLLTSAMLLHYGLKQTDDEGKTISGLTLALEMMRSRASSDLIPGSPTTSAAETESPSAPVAGKIDATDEKTGFNLKGLFSKSNDGSVRWPRLKLTGFGLPSQGQVGFALINGKHVVEGGSINNVKLVEILEHGVVVEYKGETKTLIVELTD